MTLEPDLAEKLKEYARRRRSSFKEALNTVLRRGLAAQEPLPSRRRFVVAAHSGAFKPGLDLSRLNQLVDELETEDFVRESRPTR